MLYNQPLATRFGTDLLRHIASNNWTSLDVAVAWVRASGVAHLQSGLEVFLRAGNRFSIVVGLDLFNTTKEGLEALVALSTVGNAEVFVYYNESGGIFHPKLYLFKSARAAKLIVGSNNLTESGLYSNTEAGLEVDLPLADATIRAADEALQSWKDTATDLARRVDAALIAELVAEGYVRTEADVHAEYAGRRTARAPRRRLFGSVPVTVPRPTGGVGAGRRRAAPRARPAASPTGQALIMRIRKAHATDRPTQTQLPIRVTREPFFSGITAVTSSHNGQSHGVIRANARGGLNTLKLEIPEMRAFADPVIRFQRTAGGVNYEVYDAGTPRGRTIMRALNAGLGMAPPQTHLTLPNDRNRATWWRFI